jgi:hypothetical protein
MDCSFVPYQGVAAHLRGMSSVEIIHKAIKKPD